jgi:hypothetical protein
MEKEAEASTPKHTPDRRFSGGRKGIAALAGAFLLVAAAVGIRDQIRLKRGFEDYRMALGTTDPQNRSLLLQEAANSLDAIVYPLPETHDRWCYRSSIAMEQGDYGGARDFLRRASRYRHSLQLYQLWDELGRRSRSPELSLEAVRGLQIYNPCWSGFHKEAARLERLLGNTEAAVKAEKEAARFHAVEKPLP